MKYFLDLAEPECSLGYFGVVLTQGRRVCICACWSAAETFIVYILVHNGTNGHLGLFIIILY